VTIQYSGDTPTPRKKTIQPTEARDVEPPAKAALPLRPGLLKREETAYDSRLENKIRPASLTDYIGQTALKQGIQIALDAAKARKRVTPPLGEQTETLDHMLFYGPPGLGKTTLALLMAKEMQADVHITSAPALERPRDIIGILMGMKPGGLLFVDEIHRLNRVTEEILYPAMEDFMLDRTIGKGESAKTLRVPLPHFTLIGATTKAGALSSPLRDRFGMSFRLQFYTEDELSAIVMRSAGILNVDITPDGSFAIARRARGTPRIANRLLRRVRDFMEVKRSQRHIDADTANDAMDLLDIDQRGLDATDRAMLQIMVQNFNGGPVGLDALAASLGEDSRTLEDVYEPYLLQIGFINRTPRGRQVTPQALQHLGLAVPGGYTAQLPLLDSL